MTDVWHNKYIPIIKLKCFGHMPYFFIVTPKEFHKALFIFPISDDNVKTQIPQFSIEMIHCSMNVINKSLFKQPSVKWQPITCFHLFLSPLINIKSSLHFSTLLSPRITNPYVSVLFLSWLSCLLISISSTFITQKRSLLSITWTCLSNSDTPSNRPNFNLNSRSHFVKVL